MTTTISKADFVNSVGAEYGPGEWFEVDQDRIDLFAKATDDYQFIHIDPEAAKQTPFGTTIAHGFLSLSLLAALVPKFQPKPENVVMGINYGIDKLRFLQPVKVGSRVRAKSKIMSIDEKRPGQFLTKSEVVVEIEGEEKPALIAEWLGMTIVGED